MLLSDVLDAQAVTLSPPWTTFNDAVRGLVELLVQSGRIAPDLLEPAAQAVCERESMASTAIVEIGVSIPHARIAGVKGVVVALAASPASLYSAMAGVPISIMALVLSAPDLAGEHLNALAMLSMVLQSESVRRQIRCAPDRAQAMAILRAQEGR